VFADCVISGRALVDLDKRHLQKERLEPSALQLGDCPADLQLPQVSAVIEQIEGESERLWNPRIPVMIKAYFEDLWGVLTQLKKKVRADGCIWIVVSTSAYAGIEVPVDLIIADLGVKAGWALREVGVLRFLRSSGQCCNAARHLTGSDSPLRLRESVVILNAQPEKKPSRKDCRRR